jgi:hypothetical protein
MSWLIELNSSFWLSITGIVFGSIASCFAYAYKSKCTHIKFCCGAIDILRDVEMEVEIDSIIPTNTTKEEVKVPTNKRKSFVSMEQVNLELNRNDSFISNTSKSI